MVRRMRLMSSGAEFFLTVCFVRAAPAPWMNELATARAAMVARSLRVAAGLVIAAVGGADERAAVGGAACAAAGGRGLSSAPPTWAWGAAGERGGRLGSLGTVIALSGVPALGGTERGGGPPESRLLGCGGC